MAAQSRRTRIKTELAPTIPDWEHADNVLWRIGDLQAQRDHLVIDAQAEISAIKTRLQAAIAPLDRDIELWSISLNRFAAARSADFGRARSKKLAHGVLGWRRSRALILARDTLERIREHLSPAQRRACIKTTETIDKKALGRLTDEQLVQVGARREETDVFFVEPNSLIAPAYPAEKKS